ncbi:Oidioi.mRNA.OKI2018_I69.chr2.g4815.t1.cds [Oikopleura dioica]|uniref:Oidioi.mRNA.OKI2018_I69.chr2.g4815.t1.cds n=1 Tax=Oikopleura dioica TaxID=34765 RepID=A0ABN7T1U9_OIKDI|nr:Oidioi.mRNA.OKI2018_I69.chr2.g4815.t1.cds [Oikopleura dioica]
MKAVLAQVKNIIVGALFLLLVLYELARETENVIKSLRLKRFWHDLLFSFILFHTIRCFIGMAIVFVTVYLSVLAVSLAHEIVFLKDHKLSFKVEIK